MAGLYIHIPFCKKPCYYCDFHFVASIKNKKELIDSLIKELINRQKEWDPQSFDTVYFGGGTPTILTIKEISDLTNSIFNNYKIENNIEFTIEANPDDLTPSYIENLKRYTPINRFSIGIQSFQDNILQFLNRRHNSKQALESIINVKKAGFENITIDLMYGIPGLKTTDWEKTLKLFLEMDIGHLSAYHLGIEPKTVFSVWQKRGKFKPINEEDSLQQYEILISLMKENGYLHYEISNFAKNKQFSRHNSSYWKGIPYLGIGPSAHSFYNNVRRWNINNNTKYIDSLSNHRNDYFECENLSTIERYNDYMLTTLRTTWGADLSFIKEEFGDVLYNHCLKSYNHLKYHHGEIIKSNGKLMITEKGWFISDLLISEFFMV